MSETPNCPQLDVKYAGVLGVTQRTKKTHEIANVPHLIHSLEKIKIEIEKPRKTKKVPQIQLRRFLLPGVH
jgi:hypothetical protein